MYFRLSILLLLCVLLNTDARAQKIKLKTNLEVFERIANNVTEEIIYKPGLDRDKNFVFNITDKNNDEDNISFLKNSIKKKLKEENKKPGFTDNISEITDSNTNIVEINIEFFKIKYNGFIKNKFLGEKIVKREIRFWCNYQIKSKNLPENLKGTIRNISNDDIPYNDIEILESSPYKFTQSTIPQLSTFENIFFPLTLVIVSAITVILFFAIRTK